MPPSRCKRDPFALRFKLQRPNLQLLGFTLIELLIVLSITLFLLLIALPAFRNIVEQNRTVTVINRLVGALRYARTTAIQSRESVTLCPYHKGSNCGDDWSQGIIIFIDPHHRGVLSPDATLLRIIESVKYGRLSWNRKGNLIQMLPTGALKGQNGTFTYWPTQGDHSSARGVILSRTGRVRLKESPKEKIE